MYNISACVLRIHLSAHAHSLSRYLINKEKDAINPKKRGTKVAAHYVLDVEGGEEVVVRLRLTNQEIDAKSGGPFGEEFDDIFSTRLHEADKFYDGLLDKTIGPQQSLISRQAYAGEHCTC